MENTPSEKLAKLEAVVDYLKVRVARLEMALGSAILALLYVALRMLGLPI